MTLQLCHFCLPSDLEPPGKPVAFRREGNISTVTRKGFNKLPMKSLTINIYIYAHHLTAFNRYLFEAEFKHFYFHGQFSILSILYDTAQRNGLKS